jgi:hypothetical protein
MIYKFYGGSLNYQVKDLPNVEEFRNPIRNDCFTHMFSKYPERALTYSYELYKRYDYDKMFYVRTEQNI